MIQRGKSSTVAQRRGYGVLTVRDAKRIATAQLARWDIATRITFGLPEIDDRYHVWRVPLLHADTGKLVGELVIEARSGTVNERKSSSRQVLLRRLGVATAQTTQSRAPQSHKRSRGVPSGSKNRILLGDSVALLKSLAPHSVHLVFTSPPYYNARPDYTDYAAYEEYLAQIRAVIRECGRVLDEGRFFVMNVAPVLLRRENRTKASRRIAVPFDMHRLFIEEGFEFIDDIIWRKPEGAGWATSRGRRFAADRNPLQYKTVPVTEYVLVYRKKTLKLIDTHIRALAGTKRLAESKILGSYDITNVWDITPTSSSKHPAVFPVELARRVIRYYSFVGDTVLDPFAGIGTVGVAATTLKRHFVLIDSNEHYVGEMRARLK